MGIKILQRAMVGFGYGGIFIFIYMTLIMAFHVQTTVSELWWVTLAFILIGLYFGLSSLIYGYEKWSILKRTVMHFILSVAVFYLIALGTGAVPFMFWPILSSLIIFILIYAGIWLSHTWHYKKIVRDMNKSIK